MELTLEGWRLVAIWTGESRWIKARDTETARVHCERTLMPPSKDKGLIKP
ncbi:hypothetical protein JJB11_10950 [Ramlibacter ginsenosidimutans]|uniref:Uncharacterized protein n=1 Tax=Ramlibacter ginsenosidimutans TaxID=502333 RepID=A0A934TS65_9BURK|nr:hypothetical protein [Ramlibacter ginsenosidimutans]MBK6006611.1 hypothetical protein [Ramlibacter ginsenosidimutans]